MMNRDEVIQELSSMLKAARDRLEAIDYKSRDLYVFGAGNTAHGYKNCFRVEKLQPLAYIDNNKAGTMFNGVDVIKPNDVANKERALVMICSPQPNLNAIVSRQLNDLGMHSMNIDTLVFANHSDEILNNAEQFSDDESAEIYSTMIRYRMNPEFIMSDGGGARIPFNRSVYFAIDRFADFDVNEVFVDCGAFVGDTIEQYLLTHESVFKKIFAFEPTERTFKALSTRVDRLCREWALDDDKIVLEQAGVGEKTQINYLRQNAASGTSNAITDDKTAGTEIKVVALNDYFADQKITFLKADIESYEPLMLQGAEQIIRRDRPKMAICIYHNASDMYQIQRWIDALNLGYKFAVRHHSTGIPGTVLYAW